MAYDVGAWQIKVDGFGYPSIYGTDEDGNPGDLVAHCFADHENLICTAPELLRDCERLVELLERYGMAGGPNSWLAHAKATIIKAKSSSTVDTRHADMALDQSVPELLDALDPFVITKSGDEFTTITVRSSAIDRARSAIAKATGAP